MPPSKLDHPMSRRTRPLLLSVSLPLFAALLSFACSPGTPIAPSSVVAGAQTGMLMIAVSQECLQVDQPVTFEAQLPPELDADSTSYQWELGDGQAAQGLRVTHAYDAPGRYGVNLVATDGFGVSMSARADVLIPPQVQIVTTHADIAVGSPLRVQFTAVPVGARLDEITYRWDFGDGSQETGDVVAHQFQGSGPFRVSLVALAPLVGLACSQGSVDVQASAVVPTGGGSPTTPPPANVAPIARAGSDRIVNDDDNDGAVMVTLDGSGSTDNDGQIVRYLWLDGSTILSDGGSPTATISRAVGQHTLRLTVQDDDGASNSDEVTITVLAAPGQLEVTPSDPWTTTGGTGGPFDPAAAIYTLRNTGGSALNWTGSATQSWLNLSDTSGTLAAGATKTVSLSLTGAAASLNAGTYAGAAVFTAEGETPQARYVTLQIEARASSVTQYGITWTFDRSYRVGQFVNGDWWVLPDDPTGSVTVTSVSPVPTGSGSAFRNGSVVNPTTGTAQGYDGRIPDYSSALSATFPLVLGANKSLVSTISLSTSPPHSHVLGGAAHPDCALQTAAVLTVLAERPLATSFRPPYVGATKPLYDSATLQRNLLLNLAKQGNVAYPQSGVNDCARYARYFERIWLGQHKTDWQARYMNPVENMPDYYRETFLIESDASMLLLCDLPDKEKLLIAFVQHGIDTHYTSLLGAGSREMGRWPVVFAGMLLNDPTMIDNPYPFRDVDETYYGSGWTGATALWRQKPGVEHEEFNPSQWDQIESGAGCGCKLEAYRRGNSGWIWAGSALAIHLMHAETQYGHAAFLDYEDRWMGVTGEDDVTNYATILAICAGDQTGGGVNPQCSSYSTMYYKHGDTGSTFVKQMWQAHR